LWDNSKTPPGVEAAHRCTKSGKTINADRYGKSGEIVARTPEKNGKSAWKERTETLKKRAEEKKKLCGRITRGRSSKCHRAKKRASESVCEGRREENKRSQTKTKFVGKGEEMLRGTSYSIKLPKISQAEIFS
jgi:hypothetical protein